jgi:hypothetical protein
MIGGGNKIKKASKLLEGEVKRKVNKILIKV